MDVYADWVDAAGKPRTKIYLIHRATCISHARTTQRKAADRTFPKTEAAAGNGDGPALGSLEDPRARDQVRKNRDDGSEAGGDVESPQYEGEGVVGDDVDD